MSESNSDSSKSVESCADAIIDRKADHSSPNDQKCNLFPSNTSNVPQINVYFNATREPSLESLRISEMIAMRTVASTTRQRSRRL